VLPLLTAKSRRGDAMTNAARVQVLTEQSAIVDGFARPSQVISLIDYSGRTVQKYSRYLSADGSQWVRHGVFQSFNESGVLSSQGKYWHGKEHGHWCDFRDNGMIAASGQYFQGEQVGEWTYKGIDGTVERIESHRPLPTSDH
jgi:hypothetical protein